MKTGLVFLVCVWPVVLGAHDIETDFNLAPPAVIVRTAYAAGEPAAGADVVIYSPSDPATEYQTGRTDSNGVFSFVPSEQGEWRVVIDDGMGHREDTTISVGADGLVSSGPHATTHVPAHWKLIMGLSVILGLTGLLYGYKSRRSNDLMEAR